MMEQIKSSFSILLAEDDDDDYLLIQKGFKSAGITNVLYRVKDGAELMDYLHQKNKYKQQSLFPRPRLILLDLNMPRKDGREALKEIKANSELSTIPIVIFTTSIAVEDIAWAYRLDVNSFVRKPVDFKDFVGAVRLIGTYWFELVILPEDN
ncbi:MAG: response regulator [Proteobacteria bacterium]|nr:response regulator [Pseudomonadota bacterium]MBU1581997.1 response regulator [Pseudomonadota bacterium]MBU2452426.1 response regulator [Pseudomonadota bacterium]MBU2630529.1 response regulator [Pseudomonadota bacterium]